MPGLSLRFVPAARAAATLLTVALAACAGGAPAGDMGPTGLESALPGGDGRSALAYRAEFQGDVVQGLDSLMRAFHEGWRGRDPGALGALYSDLAVLREPGGALLRGRALEGWLEGTSPQTESLNLWRDRVAASGELAAVFGRLEGEAAGSAPGGRGHHLTVARREGRTWRIRSQFLQAEGLAGAVEPGVPPNPITPEQIRARQGRRRQAAEYLVDRYFLTNSTLSEWRYHWNRGDAESALALLAPDAVVGLPSGEPALGLPAITDRVAAGLAEPSTLHMAIVDFDASELIAFAVGRFHLEPAGGGTVRQAVGGSWVVVVRFEDEGPRIQALLLAPDGRGAGAAPMQ